MIINDGDNDDNDDDQDDEKVEVDEVVGLTSVPDWSVLRVREIKWCRHRLCLLGLFSL